MHLRPQGARREDVELPAEQPHFERRGAQALCGDGDEDQETLRARPTATDRRQHGFLQRASARGSQEESQATTGGGSQAPAG